MFGKVKNDANSAHSILFCFVLKNNNFHKSKSFTLSDNELITAIFKYSPNFAQF